MMEDPNVQIAFVMGLFIGFVCTPWLLACMFWCFDRMKGISS